MHIVVVVSGAASTAGGQTPAVRLATVTIAQVMS